MTHHILFVNSRMAKPITDLVFSLVKLIDSFIATSKARNKRRQTVKELGRLSDRELLDMGISRYDIDMIADSIKY